MDSMIAPINVHRISLTLLTKHDSRKTKVGFHAVIATRVNFSIDVSITTNVRLILTKLGWVLFSGYGQTDKHDFGILTWKHVCTQKISTQSLKLRVSCRSLYASPDDVDA